MTRAGMKRWVLRYSVFIVGLYIMTLGIVMIVRSSLGTSPISSLAYVVSMNSMITLGTALFLLNVILILGQLWMVRGEGGTRRDRIEILMQLPFSVLFGAFVDLNMWLTRGFEPAGYMMALLFAVAGCVIQSIGIVLEVKPNVIAMSGEGFVKYTARRYNKNFGRIKVIFDVTLVLLAVAVSLIWTHTVVGIREGTVLAALTVGALVSVNMWLLGRLRGHIPGMRHAAHYTDAAAGSQSTCIDDNGDRSVVDQ